jgi:hypothetical protein
MLKETDVRIGSKQNLEARMQVHHVHYFAVGADTSSIKAIANDCKLDGWL